MKIRQVVEALPALQKLAKQDMSLKKLYKISKLLGSLDAEIAFYNEQRNKIVAKYCDVVDNQFVPRSEDEAKLNAEIAELLNTDIDENIVEIVIGCDEDVKLSYNDLRALEGFIRIEE